MNLTACYSISGAKLDNLDRSFSHGVAVKKFAPEPVYNRIRKVELPEPIISASSPTSPQKINLIMPSFELSVEDLPIEQIAKILADAVRYRSYVSSHLLDKRISYAGSGTIEELAAAIANKANIKISVDHISRELRFLPIREEVTEIMPELAS
ncbi:MAG TPA: hypothetical protein PKA79_07005 [Oligoflexia bacterium]|nr:hypothetical protein [Oligoflexia bacterium]